MKDFKEDKVCVLLSGGSDSTLISLICKSLGKKVVSVSFELEGMKNWDCDKSEEISKRYGFEFHKVIVPNNNPKDWFLKLIKMGCSTKIQMEVLYPTLFMLDKVKSLGFKKVLSGFSNPIPDGRGEYVEFRKNHTNYWNKNCGYGTKQHLKAINNLGITTHHRKTFSPINKIK